MANPFGYGDSLSVTKDQLGSKSLILQQWASDVLELARPALIWPAYLPTKVELGRGKGDKITVPLDLTVENMGLGTVALVTGTSVPVGTTTWESVELSIDEYGRGLAKPYSIDYFSNIAMSNQIKKDLARNWGESWNTMAFGVFDNTVHFIRTIADSGSISVGSGAHAGHLSGSAVGLIYDELSSRKVPKFDDGLYRIVGNAKTLRSLKNDSGWENLQLYNRGGRGLEYSAIGKYEGFVFVEDEVQTTDGELLAFGKNVGAQAFGMPMKLEHEPNYKGDFNRVQAWAWLTIGGVGTALRDIGTYCFKVLCKV